MRDAINPRPALIRTDGIAKVVEIANRIIADTESGDFRGLAIVYVTDVSSLSGVFVDPRDLESATVLARDLHALQAEWPNEGRAH
jgi:hypothetical protein